MSAMRKISYGGNFANLAAALSLARTNIFNTDNGARQGTAVSWVAVVIIDNISTNQTATLLEAQKLRQMNVAITTIGVGTSLNMYELTAAASYPASANAFWVLSAVNLTGALLEDNVKQIVCAGEFF